MENEFTSKEIYNYINNIETREMWIDIFVKQSVDYLRIIYNLNPHIHYRCSFDEFTEKFKKANTMSLDELIWEISPPPIITGYTSS